MARTNTAEVGQIITTDVNILPFIETAQVVVDVLAARDVDGDLDANHLRLIEMWLAAHFVAVMDPVATEEQTGETRVKHFVGKAGLRLEATPYGQQAVVLDTTGRLVDFGKMRGALTAIDLGL
jgi:hypothetical protein